jgi:multiple sugar transport system permease protein/N,N'-diacetylchitobiose transport system permease protein
MSDKFTESPWFFLLPALTVILTLCFYPLVYTLWLSLHEFRGFVRVQANFIGLKNYLSILSDKQILNSFARTAYFVLVSLVVQTSLGFLGALFLNRKFKFRKVLRAIIIIPWAMPTIANAMMWEWIFHPRYGALNGLLMQLGIISNYVDWLGAPLRAMNMVILADSWKMLPLSIILLLTGLQSIPDESYEAAEIDGANWWGKFRYVTFPLLKPTLLVVLVLRTIQTFQVFDIIYILTQGGPASGTMVSSFFIYREVFEHLNFGSGATLAVITTIFVIGVSVFYGKILGEKV